jgi:Putative transposase
VAQVQVPCAIASCAPSWAGGLLESFEAKGILAYKHNGFSVDTSVLIQAHDRAGLEWLLRYCARPTFSMEQLRKAGHELEYRSVKQHSEPSDDRRTDYRGSGRR